MTSQQEGQSGTSPDHRGFVVLWRKITEWQWYTYPGAFHLFSHLIINAAHKDQFWRGVEEKRGQLITGLRRLSEETGLSVRKIRVLLDKFKSTNDIVTQTTSKYTIITICNYSHYQDEKERNDKQTTNKRQTNDKQTTQPNNVNNGNNKERGGKRFKPPGHEQVMSFFIEKDLSPKDAEFEARKFIDFYESKGWMVGKNKMKIWKSAASGWLNRRKEFNQRGNNNESKESSKAASARYLLEQRLKESGHG